MQSELRALTGQRVIVRKYGLYFEGTLQRYLKIGDYEVRVHNGPDNARVTFHESDVAGISGHEIILSQQCPNLY